MKHWRQTALVILAGLLLACNAASQTPTPVNLSTKLEPAQIKPGGKAKVLITLKLDPGWHVYALTQPAPPKAAKIALDESGPFKADGAPQQPKPKTAYDPNFEMNTQTFEGAVT